MAYANSRNERVYLQLESSFGTIPNSSGSATVANGDACRFISSQLDFDPELLQRPDKTGSLGQTAGIAGRGIGNWSLSMSLAGSGTAGTAPDCDAILQCAFGKAAAVSAGTSVTYALDDNGYSFSLWSFRTASTVAQRVAAGCVVRQARFDLGQNVAIWTVNGSFKGLVDSKNFSSLTNEEKCGLTAFPSEPGSPTTSGNMVKGYTGSFTADGNVLATIQNASIVINNDDALVYGHGYELPTDIERGLRRITASFSLKEDDSSAITNLITKSRAKTAIDISMVLGAVAGNIWTFNLSNVQLSNLRFNDSSRRWVLDFGDSQANASSITAKDEIALVIT